MKKGISRIHFVGILGAGMLPLAKLAASLGYDVSGSDARADSEMFSEGFKVSPHSSGLIDDRELVVTSFAIPDNSPEIVDAIRIGVPIVSRAQLLGELMKGYRSRVGISGSHGKSTTTALIDYMLYLGGVLPTTVPGATLFDRNDVRIGKKEVFVYEACEYRDAFLNFYPTLKIITGIELDHTDYFADIAAIRHSFLLAANRAHKVILNADFDGSAYFVQELNVPYVTYGASEHADYRCVIKEKGRESYRFYIYKHGKMLLESQTSLIGEYNIFNITAAVAAADILGIDLEAISRAISTFPGIERRMSRIGSLDGCEILYDYAHHPSEISSAIFAAKEKYGSCAVIFKPHTYSRTKTLWHEFITALSKSDFTILLDIYPARERMIEGITSENLALAMGRGAMYADEYTALSLIKKTAYPAVILMGAGDLCAMLDVIKSDDSFKEYEQG